MATHDYVLDNATGANFRADLNLALAAIVSNNSSSSEPSTKYAYQWWADTNEGVLKIRNSSNDGWVTLLQLDGTLTLEDGSASAPALGFRDDLNTGIFSSAADNVDITTGGTTRVNVSSTGINVTGTVTDDGATHDGDVTFTGASANIVFDKSDNQLEFADNAKAEFGTGGDLEIYHDGTDNHIVSTNGQINIQTSSTENSIQCIPNGAVKLFHDNNLQVITSSTGIDFADNKRANFGGESDLSIYHDGSNSYIDDSGTGNLLIRGNNIELHKYTGEDYLKCIANGAVKLYYDNVQTFETSANGIIIRGDEGAVGEIFINADQGDDFADIFRLQTDTSGVFTIANGASGSYETNIECNGNGNVELYNDNVKRFETGSLGARFFGHLFADDNEHIKLGSSQDLQIYHNGTDSIIENSTNAFFIKSSASARALTDVFIVNNFADNENIIDARANDSVDLYYDSSKKLETTSAGVTVTGTVTDSKGELRQIPQANHQGGTHTLQASDAGKHLLVDNTVTIPPTSGVFSTGDAVTLISTSGSNISVNKGSGVTMYNAADGTDANRTLATRGIATVICTGSNTYNISGAGLS